MFTLSGLAGLIDESIWTHYLKLLLGYALVETVIGLSALAFHPLYVTASAAFLNFAGTTSLGPFGIEAVKWSLAVVLIAPQSCLLGMTFPLLSAGILRAYPSYPGKALATLYCCNSLGACRT